MSIIAQRWAYSQKLGNPTAKSILAFLASHNFGGDQSCFKVRTIAAATDLTIRAVQNALKFLFDKGLIKKTPRFAESGQQLSNEYALNIPRDYAESCYAQYGEPAKEANSVDNSGGGMHQMHPPHAPDAPPPPHQMHPLNSNNINNNINKKLLHKNEQKKNSSVDKQSMKVTRQTMKSENEKKPSWAEPAKSPFSDPSKQSTSFKPSVDENDKPNAKAIEALMLSLPKHMRPKRFRNQDASVQKEVNST